MLVVMAFMGGCGGGYWGPVLEVSPPECVMGQFAVTVSPGRFADEAAADGDIAIDVIALTNEQYCVQGWFKHDLDEYFGLEGDVLRDGAPVWRARFSAGDKAPKTLAADDPHWAVWDAEGATHLVILAQQPLRAEGSSDEARRLVLPLDRSRWLNDAIDVRLMGSGLVLRTRRLPPWPGQPKEKRRRY